MKAKHLLLTACCLLACPAALAATMASQPWVTNRIAEAVAAIPQPGNYATVSNRAMSALQSHQSLQPSTNYTDRALAAFATTGTVDRAHTAYSASTAEGAMFATWAGRLSSGGSVGTDNFTYEGIVNGFTAGTNYTEAVAADIRQSYIPIDGGPIFSTVELFLNNLLHEQGMLLLELPSGGSVDAAAFVGSTQITNQGAVAAATAMAARKQDALPYPTNAIPYAAIDGAPSGGGQEWREEWGSVSMGDAVIFVTNGIFVLTFEGAEATDSVMAYTGGWPNGAAMFVRGLAVSGPYQIANNIRLVGYGTWPTNNFQSVWWRSGTNIFVNILLEE